MSVHSLGRPSREGGALLPVGTERPARITSARVRACMSASVLQAIYHRDRPVRVYLMMWGVYL